MGVGVPEPTDANAEEVPTDYPPPIDALPEEVPQPEEEENQVDPEPASEDPWLAAQTTEAPPLEETEDLSKEDEGQGVVDETLKHYTEASQDFVS